MAYDEELDERVMEIATAWGATRKKMFGGTGYLLNGNMMAGVHGERLILRLSADEETEALAQPHVGPFDLTRRPMAGWVQVDLSGLEGRHLEDWLERAWAFVQTLPPK